MADRVLQLKLISDVAGINKGVADVNSKLSGLESTLKKVGAAFVAAFAVGEVINFATAGVEAASDIQEATTKLEALLGPAASVSVAFAESAVSMGLSKEAALEAQGTFANLFRTIGLTEGEAATASAEFTQLAVDLASFNNTTVDDAILAIGAGLRGESEPLRRFGVLLDDATLKAAALEQGLYDGVGSLDAQTRAAAAMSVIFAQTTIAQGDFARTSDGLANSQKQLGAQLANVQASLGMVLLPIMTELARIVLEEVIPALQRLWADVGPGIQQLVETLGPKLQGAITTLMALWTALLPHLQNLQAIVQPLIDGVLANLVLGFEAIMGVIDAVIALLNGDFTAAWNAIEGVMENFKTMIGNAIGAVLQFLQNIVPTLFEVAGKVGGAIFDGVMNVVSGLADAIIKPFRDGWNGLARMLNNFEVPGMSLPNPLHGTVLDPIGQPHVKFWDAFKPLNVPMLAKGGIVRSPTLAMIGEAGPEAVVPLGRGGGMGNEFNITVNVAPGADMVQTGRQIVEAIRQYERRSGAVWRAA